MTEREDNRMVDYLYGEMAEKERRAFEDEMAEDAQLAESMQGFASMLKTIRSVEPEEPSVYLDSLVLAQARQRTEQNNSSWLRSLLGRPTAALALCGAFAVILAVVVIPQMSPRMEGEEARSMVETSPVSPAESVSNFADEKLSKPSVSTAVINNASGEGATGAVEKTERPDFRDNGARAFGSRSDVKTHEDGVSHSLSGGRGAVARAHRAKKAKSRLRVIPTPQPVLAKPKVVATQSDESPRVVEELFELRGRDSVLRSPGVGGVVMKSKVLGPKAQAQLKEIAAVSGKPARRRGMIVPPPVATRAPLSMVPSMVDSEESGSAAESEAEPPSEMRRAASSAARAPTTDGDREAWARQMVRTTQTKAKKLIKEGHINAARDAYLAIRPSVRGTMAFFEVSLWLAQLEYAQGRYEFARRYAQEASRSRDQRIQDKAREVVARAREDESPAKTMPASH